MLLHGTNELPPLDIEERSRMRQRVGAELLSQPFDRGTQALHRDVSPPELSQQPRLDHLAPGDRIATARLWSEHRLVEAPSA